VNSLHEQWVGRSLPLNHFRIKAVKEGLATDEKVAIMGKAGRDGRRRQGVGSQWESSVVSYLMSKASELFSKNDGRVHAVYYLRGGHVAFYADEGQLAVGDSQEVDVIEVRFRVSKADQGRKGAVLMRMDMGGGRWSSSRNCTGCMMVGWTYH